MKIIVLNKDALNCSHVTVRTFTYLQKILFKKIWLFWALFLSENPEKNQAAQLFSVLMQVRNVSWAPSVYIIMISKALCEMED